MMGEDSWENGTPKRLDDAHDDADAPPPPATRPRLRSVMSSWRTGDHVELAEKMLERVEAHGPRIVFTAGAFWAYVSDVGIWTQLDYAEMSQVIQGFAGQRIPKGPGKTAQLKIRAGDVKGAIELAGHQRHKSDDWFCHVPAGLAFSDGYVRVRADGAELESFSADTRARHAYSFPFRGKYDAAPWLRFLAGLVRDDADAGEKLAFLQEFFGASLLGLATKYQRALFCTGGGRNGKSTLFAILRSVFPPGAVSEIAPHSLRDDYSRAALGGKLLNIVAETSTRELLDTESFKALVTGDALQARQPYGRVFTLRPNAGHAFAPQSLPDVADTSDGFWRRPVVIELRRQFTDADDDKGLAVRLSDGYGPAIVMWLIEGAQRLIANGAYTLPASHYALLNKWRKASNNVALFADEMLIAARVPTPTGVHDWTLSTVLYEKYRVWVTANGYRGVAANTFGKRLAQLGYGSTHTQRGTLYAAKIVGMYDATSPT